MRSTLRGSLVPLLLLLACGGNEYAPPPPAPVTVSRPIVRDVTRYIHYTGSTRAGESAVVTARVQGILKAMNFRQGDQVEAGDSLFVIDPEPFELALKSARAELISAKAERDLAQTEFKRTEKLYRGNATSEIKYIQSRARRDKAEAAMLDAEARVRQAELDVEYAMVRAPISGRAGRNLVDIGNLVGAGEATPLTEIVRYSPLYVYFYISERDVLEIQEQTRREREQAPVPAEAAPPSETRAAPRAASPEPTQTPSATEADRGAAPDVEAPGTPTEPEDAGEPDREPTPFQVARATDRAYPYEGVIDFAALQVDPDTGTFELRGILANEGELEDIILPGTFVRVRVPVGESEDALLVTERALGVDQSGRFLLTVNSQNIVEQRRVEVGPPRIDGLRVITDGLRTDDRVIINGIQRARPGSEVAPREVSATEMAGIDAG